MSLNSKGFIRTVTGDLPPQELGHVQCHEHIYLRSGPGSDQHKALVMEDIEKSTLELADYKNAGGNAIVDAQPGFFGRDPKKLRELSERTKIAIIATTGFHKLSFLEDPSFLKNDRDALSNAFSTEVTEGMLTPDGKRTAIRAGIIKIAFDVDFFENPHYPTLLHAAVSAAYETGAPLLIHTEKGNDLHKLVDLCEKGGISPDRVLICHLDRTNPNQSLHRELMSRGCVLCFDSINRLKYVSHEEEFHLLSSLLDQGFEDKIVLSLDTTNERLRSYYAKDMGLDYILTDYIPFLARNRVPLKVIDKLCRTNGSKILSIK